MGGAGKFYSCRRFSGRALALLVRPRDGAVTGPRASTSLAVLGFGSIGRRHVSIALEHGYDVRVFDPALRAARRPPGCAVVQSADEALEGAHAAVIASPTSVHLEQARLALERGCHVLVEKPLATSRRRGGGAAVARARARPAARRCDEPALPSGSARRPRGSRQRRDRTAAAGAFHVRLLPAALAPAGRLPRGLQRAARPRRRGAARRHPRDRLRGLDPRSGRRACRPHVAQVSDLEVDVEDMATVQLHFSHGAVASMDLDYLDRSYRRGCRIVGSEGSVAWSWHQEHIVVYGPNGEEEVRPTPSDVAPSYREQLAAFLTAIEDEHPRLDDTGLVDGRRGAARAADRRRGARVVASAAAASPCRRREPRPDDRDTGVQRRPGRLRTRARPRDRARRRRADHRRRHVHARRRRGASAPRVRDMSATTPSRSPAASRTRATAASRWPARATSRSWTPMRSPRPVGPDAQRARLGRRARGGRRLAHPRRLRAPAATAHARR